MSPHLLVNNQFVHCKGGNVVMLAANDIEVSHMHVACSTSKLDLYLNYKLDVPLATNYDKPICMHAIHSPVLNSMATAVIVYKLLMLQIKVELCRLHL